MVELFAIAILDTFIDCEFPSPSILAYMTAIRNFIAAWQALRKRVQTFQPHHAAALSIANDVTLLEA